MVRGPAEHSTFVDRIVTVTTRLGDDYHLTVAHWDKGLPGTAITLRDLAKEHGDRYLEISATIGMAAELASDQPNEAGPLLHEALALADSSGFRDLRLEARMAQAEAAAASGSLAESIELAESVLESASLRRWPDAMRVVSFAGLLSQHESAIHRALDIGERALDASPGPND